MTLEELAKEIREHEDRAEELEGDAEDSRWAAALGYYQAVAVEKAAPGAFAKLVGKSVDHVRRMRRTWEQFDSPDKRGDKGFWDCYEQANRSKPKATRGSTAQNLSEEDSSTEEVTFRATRRTGFAKVDKCLEDAASELKEALAVARGLDLDGEQKDIIAERLAVLDVPLDYLRRMSESEPASGIADEVEAYLKANA